MNLQEFVKAFEEALELPAGQTTPDTLLSSITRYDSMGRLAIMAMADTSCGSCWMPMRWSGAKRLRIPRAGGEAGAIARRGQRLPIARMNTTRWATIEAIRSYLPEKVVTNADLSPEVGWTAEEIFSKTGIAQRHVAGPKECVSDMAVLAAEKLFRECAADRAEVEFLILCTQTPDHFLPATACLVQHTPGAEERVRRV